MQDTSPILELTKAHVADFRYDRAAEDALNWLASRTVSVDDCLQTIRLLLMGNLLEEAHTVSAQLFASAGSQDQRVVKMHCFVLASAGSTVEAYRVFREFIEPHNKKGWLVSMLEAESKPFLKGLAEHADFSAHIADAAIAIKYQCVFYVANIACVDCGEQFRVGNKASPFRMLLGVCPKCFRPQIVRPLRLVEKLAETQRPQDEKELMSIDLHCWDWVHQWHKNISKTSAITSDFSENIAPLLWSQIRAVLGEYYVRLFNRQRQKTELL